MISSDIDETKIEGGLYNISGIELLAVARARELYEVDSGQAAYSAAIAIEISEKLLQGWGCIAETRRHMQDAGSALFLVSNAQFDYIAVNKRRADYAARTAYAAMVSMLESGI